MAHIGTLKVMEKAGLRPDYITGVSMGSIVGVGKGIFAPRLVFTLKNCQKKITA